MPAFRAAHHHWIFPVLAALLAGQWLITVIINQNAARAGVLSSLSLILVMGVVRHATILACFDRCGFKLAAAALIAAAVFLAQRSGNDAGFWDPLRSGIAAAGALFWALYLALRAAQVAPWMLNGAFTIIALILWLGRGRATCLILSLGTLAALAIRMTSEISIIFLTLMLLTTVAAGAHRVQDWLRARPPKKELPKTLRRQVLRGVGLAAVTAGLGIYVIGPVFLMTDPGQRRALLAKRAPLFPTQDPKTLSPLASRLRGHVVALAGTIGERDAYQRKQQEQARDYILRRFKEDGYAPQSLAYASRSLASVENGTRFFNIEAGLGALPADIPGVWIIGAHYDSASDTPGADDNASGVAVLIEAARMLKESGRRPAREIRFVAFGTEEPPSFGTRNMGSHRYAQRLKDRGAQVLGMISLEMLGYYNPKPGSQLYPPFLHLLYPDRGTYVGAVGNMDSRRLLAAFKAAWNRGSRFPLITIILPGPFSGMALSDQLNFWDQGYPALLLSDTAFYRNPNYHENTDTPDTLDYEKMAHVARALAALLSDDDFLSIMIP